MCIVTGSQLVLLSLIEFHLQLCSNDLNLSVRLLNLKVILGSALQKETFLRIIWRNMDTMFFRVDMGFFQFESFVFCFGNFQTSIIESKVNQNKPSIHKKKRNTEL